MPPKKRPAAAAFPANAAAPAAVPVALKPSEATDARPSPPYCCFGDVPVEQWKADHFDFQEDGGFFCDKADWSNMPVFVDGPKSLDELMRWPDNAVRKMFGVPDAVGDEVSRDEQERRCRFQRCLNQGVCIGSNYSGMLTPEIALDQVVKAAQAQDFGIQIPTPCLHSAWTCDVSPECRKIGMKWTPSSRWQSFENNLGCHVFGDLMDMLSPEAIDAVHRFRQYQNAGLGEQGLETLTRWFFKNADTALKDGHCFRHGARCRTSNFLTSTWGEDPVTIETAGSICIGWTLLGKKEGEMHESHVVFLVWACHVRKSKPVILLHECSSGMKWSIMVYWFDDIYELHDINLEPKLIGHPVNRPGRRYTWGIRKDYKFTGATADFCQMFATNMQVTGDIFFAAPEDSLKQELTRLVKNRKMNPNALDVSKVQDWSRYYPPGAQERLKKLKYVLQKYEPHNPQRSVVIADLDQNAGYGPSSSQNIPTLVTHGCIHSLQRKRCLVPDEHLLAMGFPVLEGLHNFPIPWQPLLNELSPAVKKRLAGNGMYLPLVGLSLLYLLGNIEKRGEDPRENLRFAGRSFSHISFESDASPRFVTPPSSKRLAAAQSPDT